MVGRSKDMDIQDKAEQLASEAADSLREIGRGARDQADDVKKDAVRLLNDAADTIRKEARARGSKQVKGGADDVAKSLEQAAHYLKRHSFEDMGEDVVETVKSNPWKTLGIIFVVGLIIGLIMRGGDDK